MTEPLPTTRARTIWLGIWCNKCGCKVYDDGKSRICCCEVSQ